METPWIPAGPSTDHPPRPRVHASRRTVYWMRRAIVALVFATIVVVRLLRGHPRLRAHQPELRQRRCRRARPNGGASHGLGVLVTWVEAEAYRLNPARSRRHAAEGRLRIGTHRGEGPGGRAPARARGRSSRPPGTPLAGRGCLARRRARDRQRHPDDVRGVRSARRRAHELRRGRRVDGPDRS